MSSENTYLILKTFEDSLISLTRDSDKPKTIGRQDFLETIGHLEKREFIEETDEMNQYKITNIGLEKLKELNKLKEQKEKDEKAERYKLYNESVMSGWKRKTFWYIFALGLFGGIYSGIDLFNKITDNQEIQEKDNQEDKSSKIKTISKDTLSKSTKLKNTQID